MGLDRIKSVAMGLGLVSLQTEISPEWLLLLLSDLLASPFLPGTDSEELELLVLGSINGDTGEHGMNSL